MSARKAVFLFWSCLFASHLDGKPIRVPGEHTTLQAAIDAAADGDVVLVAPGVYRGPENRGLGFGGKAIVLEGEEGPGSTIIDCDGADRAFHFTAGEAEATVVSGFTIQNGKAPKGGGALCEAGTRPTFRNCVFQGNEAITGGGIYCSGKPPATVNPGTGVVLVDCSLVKNCAAVAGGGLASEYASVRLEGCAIAGNLAGARGGGIACRSSFLTLEGCEVKANVSDQDGGGVHLQNDPTSILILRRTTVAENHSGDGTGLFITGNAAAQRIESCTFSGNSDRLSGNGSWVTGSTITAVSTSSLSLTNCIVWGNIGRPLTLSPSASHLIRVSFSCIEGAETFPGLGNIRHDPQFCGWGSRGEVFVDGRRIEPGDGTEARPFSSLAPALGFSLALAPGSPCRGSGEGGMDMGAVAGECGEPRAPRRSVYLAMGTYDMHGLTLAQRASIEGRGEMETVLRGTVVGLRTGESLSRLTVTGGRFSGVVITGEQEPALRQVTITGNSSPFAGGGIQSVDATPVLDRCTIRGNVVSPGGQGLGGGILLLRHTQPPVKSCTITGCRIEANVASRGMGGGLCSLSSSLVVVSTVFVANQATIGGGAHMGGTPRASFTNCLFTLNELQNEIHGELFGGGAALADGHVVSFDNCTISGNRAQHNPGLVFLYSSSPSLVNCIVWGHDGSPLAGRQRAPLMVRHSIVEGGAPGEGNLDLDPLFVAPARLDDGGTPEDPSDDRWIDGDYRLRPGSAAVDAGDAVGELREDLDGNPRPCGGGIDIGAYELCGPVPEPEFLRGDSNQDARVDLSDAVAMLGFLFLGARPPSSCAKAADANDDGGLDVSDPVAILGALFRGAEVIAPPSERCGVDPTEDGLPCPSSPACP